MMQARVRSQGLSLAPQASSGTAQCPAGTFLAATAQPQRRSWPPRAACMRPRPRAAARGPLLRALGTALSRQAPEAPSLSSAARRASSTRTRPSPSSRTEASRCSLLPPAASASSHPPQSPTGATHASSRTSFLQQRTLTSAAPSSPRRAPCMWRTRTAASPTSTAPRCPPRVARQSSPRRFPELATTCQTESSASRRSETSARARGTWS